MNKQVQEALDLVRLPGSDCEKSLVGKVEEAVSLLSKAVNVMGSGDEAGKAFAGCLMTEHRTLQASIVKMFQSAMKIYQHSAADLWNEGAVEFARQVSAIGICIPFV